jgi:hypothetical protein
MKAIPPLIAGALLFQVGACAHKQGGEVPAGLQTRRFEASLEDFPNPERGFAKADWASAAATRQAGLSLRHHYFRLDAYKSKVLPDAFLREVEEAFASARAAGVKLVPRFTYNFPSGLPLKPEDGDAPLPLVLSHIDQLAPVLARNADTMAFLEAGFIGAWGEWHHSTNGLDETAAKVAVLDRLLKTLPQSRMVVLRYQRDKKAVFGRTTPLTLAEAFSGSNVARVGHHNDCFLASASDWDTYRPDDPASLRAQKAYLAEENRFVPQGGETCNVGEDAQPFIGCKNALFELKALRWSQMKIDFHPDVIARWRTEGCFPEIARRLGYRLRLTQAVFPKAVQAGSRLTGSISVANDGFAGLYNPRPVELVLRNRASKSEAIVPLKVDPRRWAAGAASDVRIHQRLPASLKPGTYDLLLNLPDASPRLRGRPEYSVRVANKDVWEAATGYNNLGLALTIQR